MTVKELRKKTGLSQSKFAEKYKINLWTLKNWEQGKGEPLQAVVHLLTRVITEVDYKDK